MYIVLNQIYLALYPCTTDQIVFCKNVNPIQEFLKHKEMKGQI